MSFALTTDQVENRTKDVTRRMGWLHLKAGDQVQPVKKCMGLKPGEKVEKIGPPVTVLSVWREPLQNMLINRLYGNVECEREGFPDFTPEQFVDMYCKANGCKPADVVTRIEFEYPA